VITSGFTELPASSLRIAVAVVVIFLFLAAVVFFFVFVVFFWLFSKEKLGDHRVVRKFRVEGFWIIWVHDQMVRLAAACDERENGAFQLGSSLTHPSGIYYSSPHMGCLTDIQQLRHGIRTEVGFGIMI
jgi:hypothetical protein